MSRPTAGRTALQAVLFDMDGLLVDSEPLWFEVEAAVMARLGGRWTARRPAGARRRVAARRTVDYLLDRAAGPPPPSRWPAGWSTG